jgi:RNA polymerase sigma-70 factor (ECF subfamily)
VAAEEFDRLYHAHYGNVVAMAYALTGDLAEAQDLAQEAFCRAWQRWRRISGYDDPLAWIRRVVANLASSRWRRLRSARRHHHRERATHIPAPGPEHVALVAALRTLPAAQRHAIVLYHLADLPVAEVAAELGAAEGTVKAWLHRGRAALATQLAEPPDADARDATTHQPTHDATTREPTHEPTHEPTRAPTTDYPTTSASGHRIGWSPTDGGEQP